MSDAADLAPADPTTPKPAPPRGKPPIWKRRPWLIGGTAAVLLAVVAVVASLLWSLPLGRALEPLANPTLVIVAADGSPIARRGSYKEAPVDVAKLPPYVAGAFVAIEDRRFYRHIGVDPKAILRAMGANAKAGGVSEGGSTITQQLAKNAFLSNKRTFRRKIQEVLIALYLDARLSKDEILSRYLSSVYFGDGTFGLGAASRHYFDKTPQQLSIGEAAMLAGLVKAPSRWAPTENFDGARTRMKTVLGAMVDTGVITQAQADRAATQVHVQTGRPKLPVGSYFADWVFPQAKAVFENTYGETVVRTTLDPKLQAQAEKILDQAIARDGKALNVTQGAIVAMRTDGRIVAMVGGRDYKASQFNRADAQRPPGSAFKLFVYLAAIRQGMTPTSPILDAPVQVSGWTPKNHEGKYAGREVPLITAFAASSNVAAVRLAHDIGRDAIVRTARDLGVTDPIPNDLTLALGTGPMSLVRLTAAYAAIDAGEAPVIPHGLADWKKPAGVHPLTKAELASMRDLLRSATQRGTGVEAAIPGAFGKTGTSQDYRDALFVGYVGDLVIGVWVGNDDNRPMNGVVGGGLPAKIWKSVATYAVNRDAPRAAEPEDDDAVSAAEDPTLLNPDGTPVDGSVPEGGEVPLAEGSVPPAPDAPAAPPAPVISAPPAPAAPASERQPG
ncbi:transglycosylase domain-containing protein [Caulobacter sp. BK020]|uniref:transglycosylase domain-containing protein n=1 Tax=Caulobacter sp. BK020 TaxID=2512117 RepID=UPI0010F412A3|nr:transglycosylase domain-containing protein [Caulobacter sp. BK020]TCS13720.1 membrane peptidoglycan carboxypeptidase [Caulobacter sp. BK020]